MYEEIARRLLEQNQAARKANTAFASRFGSLVVGGHLEEVEINGILRDIEQRFGVPDDPGDSESGDDKPGDATDATDTAASPTDQT